MKCTVHCLNNCQGVVGTEGIGQAQVCFQNCNQVCVIGCALSGEPSLQAFNAGWSSTDFFKAFSNNQQPVQQNLISTESLIFSQENEKSSDLLSLPTFD